MFPSNPCFVLALLAVSSCGNFLVSVDGKCAIEPVDGHVNWPSKKKKIRKRAFKNCKELVTICIPPEVESIHNTAFVQSGLDLTKLYEVPCDADPSPLFSFKGPQQIVKSVEGEPAAVLAAPPTDYFLQFTIELKSTYEYWTNIITLTDDGQAYPDYLYGQLVPGVFVSPGTTQIVAYYGDDENGQLGIYSQSLELNKKSTVLIKVYGTTVTISVNGVIDNSRTVGPRAQLNDVSLYIGDPWNYPADAIVSDISFGLV